MLLTIGTPHAGHYAAQYVHSLTKTLLQQICDYEVLALESCYVHSGRNSIFNQARGDYLLFIDSDMAWEPEQVASLLRAGKDIVGGLYYKRRPPYGPVVYSHDGSSFQPMKTVPPRLFKCQGIGTGFLLISRAIIDRFKSDELIADWGFAFDPIKVETPGTSNSYYVGEDLSFCAKCDHIGLEIYCDPETVVRHVGTQEVMGPL